MNVKAMENDEIVTQAGGDDMVGLRRLVMQGRSSYEAARNARLFIEQTIGRRTDEPHGPRFASLVSRDEDALGAGIELLDSGPNQWALYLEDGKLVRVRGRNAFRLRRYVFSWPVLISNCSSSGVFCNGRVLFEVSTGQFALSRTFPVSLAQDDVAIRIPAEEWTNDIHGAFRRATRAGARRISDSEIDARHVNLHSGLGTPHITSPPGTFGPWGVPPGTEDDFDDEMYELDQEARLMHEGEGIRYMYPERRMYGGEGMMG